MYRHLMPVWWLSVKQSMWQTYWLHECVYYIPTTTVPTSTTTTLSKNKNNATATNNNSQHHSFTTIRNHQSPNIQQKLLTAYHTIHGCGPPTYGVWLSLHANGKPQVHTQSSLRLRIVESVWGHCRLYTDSYFAYTILTVQQPASFEGGVVGARSRRCGGGRGTKGGPT